MTYEASTFLYAIAVAIFALGGMVGGFTGGLIANKCGRFVLSLVLKEQIMFSIFLCTHGYTGLLIISKIIYV